MGLLNNKKKEVKVAETQVENVSETEQLIEVEYDKNLVEEYKNNYIQDVEGMGAGEDAEPYGMQDNFNTDTVNELLGEGAEIDVEYKSN